MNEVIRPVRYGILIGLLGIVFGIGWAFWLVLGHEKIHEILEKCTIEGREERSLINLLEPAEAQAHSKEKPTKEETGHMHLEAEERHGVKETELQEATEGHQQGTKGESGPHLAGGHDNPIIELSHRRLTRGHIHTTGLGLATIMISLVLTFTSAPDKVKTTASILTGIGGIVYPIAWILMGYRTPALGPDGADMSVRFIAGPGIALVAIGIFTAVVFLVRDIIEAK